MFGFADERVALLFHLLQFFLAARDAHGFRDDVLIARFERWLSLAKMISLTNVTAAKLKRHGFFSDEAVGPGQQAILLILKAVGVLANDRVIGDDSCAGQKPKRRRHGCARCDWRHLRTYQSDGSPTRIAA